MIKYTKEEKELLNEVLFHLHNGMQTESGEVRPFDILDYIMMANGCSLERLKRVTNIVLPGKEDTKPIVDFVTKNTDEASMNNYNIKCLLETIDEVNCKIDKNGFPIPGTGTKIMPVDKMKLVELLKENHFPLTVSTYCAAYKRYVNHWPLEFDKVTYKDESDEKKMTLSKK